jgi:ubiquinone biosynthesis protein Coq4
MLHIVLGMPFSVAGEVGAKWFEMVHTQLPMAALAAVAGPIKMETGPCAHGHEYITWAATAAKQVGLRSRL